MILERRKQFPLDTCHVFLTYFKHHSSFIGPDMVLSFSDRVVDIEILDGQNDKI